MSDDHGKLGTYTNQRCRCDRCRRAMRLYQRARRARLAGWIFPKTPEPDEHGETP